MDHIDDSVPGARIYWTDRFDPIDMTVHKGAAVTTPERTIIDCADDMGHVEIEEMIRKALDMDLLTTESLLARALDLDRPGHPGPQRVMDVLLSRF